MPWPTQQGLGYLSSIPDPRPGPHTCVLVSLMESRIPLGALFNRHLSRNDQHHNRAVPASTKVISFPTAFLDFVGILCVSYLSSLVLR